MVNRPAKEWERYSLSTLAVALRSTNTMHLSHSVPGGGAEGGRESRRGGGGGGSRAVGGNVSSWDAIHPSRFAIHTIPGKAHSVLTFNTGTRCVCVDVDSPVAGLR